MINAYEAKQRTKKSNENLAKISPILGNINGQIITACDKGKNNLFISETQFEGLSVEQMNIIISKIKCLGYNVNPIYENTIAGYEVTW